MMENQIETLQKRIFSRKKVEPSELTAILGLGREFGCLGEIVGREFEVLDKHGKLVYKIVQKPLSIPVLNNLLKELDLMKRLEEEEMKERTPKPKGRRR